MNDTVDNWLAALGHEGLAKIAGAYFGRMHRQRPRLLFEKSSSPARAPHYLAFVRELPCVVCCAPGPNDPHHAAGPRGVAQKTDDYRAVPLCRRCHEAQHAGNGPDLRAKQVDALVSYLRVVEQT